MEDKLKELINRECDKILGEIIRKDFDPRKPESSLLFKTEYCKNVICNPKVQEKIKNTNLEKYGVSSPAKSNISTAVSRRWTSRLRRQW